VLRRFFPGSSDPRRPATGTARSRDARSRLLCEQLEEREVPSVTLATISQPDIANNKPTYLPVTVTNTPAGPVTTTVTSDNAGVAASVVQGGQSVRFDVTGTDSNGVPFTGSMTVMLFPNSAPNAVQRIIDLVNSGYYNGKLFPRVVDTPNPFVIQGGGSSTSDNSPLPSLQAQFNQAYQFNSPGIMAMANTGNSASDNSQFFITALGQSFSATMANLEAPLNLRYSIVGILTSGSDIYQKILTTKTGSDGQTPVNNVTITSATLFTDTSDAVIELNPTKGFTGTANITVTANDGTGPTTLPFSTTGMADTSQQSPYLGPLSSTSLTTTEGTATTLTIPVVNPSGAGTTIAVGSSTSITTAPQNMTVSINQTTGVATLTPNAGFTGTITFEVGVKATSAADTGSVPYAYDTQAVTLTVSPPPTTSPPPPPATTSLTAVGSAPGTTPEVIIKNADGSVRFTVPVFDPSFLGGVNVAVGPVTGAGSQAVLATPGYGGGPIMLVINPATGTIAHTITMFNPAFRGGINLQVGDAAGLGYDQVLVGAGPSGGPRAMLLNLVTDTVMLNFFTGDPNTRGGTSVDLGTVFKSKGEMIVAGSGPGTSPVVTIYSATTGAAVGSFPVATSTITTQTGVRVRIGTPDPTSGNALIYAAPENSPIGSSETPFDPTQFITFPTGA